METHRISPVLGSGAEMPCLAVDTSPRVTDTGLSASHRLRFAAVNVLFRSFLSCQHARFSVMQLFYTQTPKLLVFIWTECAVSVSVVLQLFWSGSLE